MRIPRFASSALLDSLTTIVPLIALGTGCGSGAPPPTHPNVTDPSSPPASSASTPGSPAASAPAGPTAATPQGTATAAADTATTRTPGPPPPGAPQRLEDMKVNKTKSTGGQYGLAVQSASGIASDDVGRALVSITPRTDECYGKLFKKQVNATGKTSFDVTISAKGKTQSVKLRSDDLKDADLVKCLEAAVKTVAWPTPTDKAGGKTTLDWVVQGN
jgi:hypothetical protein